MSKYDELEKLKKLLDDGTISHKEFNLEKDKLLAEDVKKSNSEFWGMEKNTFIMIMHLAQLVNFCFIGIIIPIVMWLTNKEFSEEVDQHGKNIINWMISALIYLVVSLVLSIVLIGILGIFALFISQ